VLLWCYVCRNADLFRFSTTEGEDSSKGLSSDTERPPGILIYYYHGQLDVCQAARLFPTGEGTDPKIIDDLVISSLIVAMATSLRILGVS
jgi:hypothetical protein